MVHYTDPVKKKGRIRLKTADSIWSKPIGVDSAGTSGNVELKQRWNVSNDRANKLYVLGVSIAVAEGKFRRTKVVTIAPRFVLMNGLERSIKVKQQEQSRKPFNVPVFPLHAIPSSPDSAMSRLLSKNLLGTNTGSPDSLSIRAGERLPFHWEDSSKPREICVSFDEYGWTWSGGFAITNIGEFAVRLRNQHTHAVYILRVEVALGETNSGRNNSTVYITFRPELPLLPPYRIDNFSLQNLRLRQRGSLVHDVLLPYHTCPYTWDDLSLPRTLVVESVGTRTNRTPYGGTTSNRTVALLSAIWRMLKDQGVSHVDESHHVTLGEYELDRLQPLQASSKLPHITIGVHADGPTRVLSVVDARIKGAEPSNQTKNSSDLEEGGIVLNLDIYLAGFGLSLVEAAPRRELLYLSVSQIHTEFRTADDLSRVLLKVGLVQVDNQLHGAYYPVLFSTRTTHSNFLLHQNMVLDKGEDGREASDQGVEELEDRNAWITTRPVIECSLVSRERIKSCNHAERRCSCSRTGTLPSTSCATSAC